MKRCKTSSATYETRNACPYFALIRNGPAMGRYNHRARRENRKPALTPYSRQLVSNLFIREIQPHKIEAEHPDAQRLVVAGKDRPSEVVEPLLTDGALILLSFRLGFVVPLFRDLERVAVGAGHPLGPTHRSDGLKAPGIVNELQGQ